MSTNQEKAMTRIYTPEEKRRIDKIKAAAQKVKIRKACKLRDRANAIDEQNYIKQMSEVV